MHNHLFIIVVIVCIFLRHRGKCGTHSFIHHRRIGCANIQIVLKYNTYRTIFHVGPPTVLPGKCRRYPSKTLDLRQICGKSVGGPLILPALCWRQCLMLWRSCVPAGRLVLFGHSIFQKVSGLLFPAISTILFGKDSVRASC